jgi:predicted negative regulator of RcsB-dependent stress response
MTDHLTDDEQVERIKQWWKENGVAVITGIVIGLAGVVGVRYWFNYQEQQAVEASRLYSTYMTAVEKKDSDKATQDSQQLKKDYAGTSYAALAAMQQAGQNIEQGNLDAAAANLQWAVDHPGHDAIAHLARIRLANVLIVQNKYAEALQLIKDVKEPAFDARYAELRGDIYAAQDKKAQARSEYETALASNDITGKQREFVAMKLNDLGAVE